MISTCLKSENQLHEKQIVIITGMHRSGTSLTASVLQKAGVNIGENLYPVLEGNTRGHYEDLDFLEFHQEILYSQGINPSGWSSENKLSVPEEYVPKAKEIVKARLAKGDVWGWKDPRTTLFLDFWRDLLPGAKYIFVYRSPWEVVDSLFRRATDPIFSDEPKLAVKMWMVYNSALLDFYSTNSERTILVHADNLRGEADTFLAFLIEKLKISVHRLEKPVFDISLMHKDRSSYKSIVLAQYFPAALDLYEKLNKVADLPGQIESPMLKQVNVEEVYEDSFFQNWMEIRLLEKDIKLCKDELSRLQTESAYFQQVIQTMKESRFWKVREALLRLKHLMGA